MFSQHSNHIPKQLGSMGCSEPLGIRSEVLKLAVPRLFYAVWVLEYKQIATSKDTMKDLPLVEKICYFKNGLVTYPNKNSKTIFYIFVLKNEKLFSFSLENYVQYIECEQNL